ncbi:MAG: DNA repair protein RadC [Anaerolineaceae bacterium]|nr:DNA repair protein RadC [Anaerolineaceae bacterium]
MSNKNVTSYRIMDLDVQERPRERLAAVGAQALSKAELLAILLRVGVQGENAVHMGQRLLNDMGGLLGLQSASFVELRNQHGIGAAKAAQIKAALELGKRLRALDFGERPAIHEPRDVFEMVRDEMSALPQEHLWVMLLTIRNQVIHTEKLYKGSLNASTVRVAEVFKPAIQHNAASVILVHNHPSGDPGPSPEDVTLTRAAVEAGKLLDIKVLDHLIIGHGRFVSLKEQKKGFD